MKCPCPQNLVPMQHANSGSCAKHHSPAAAHEWLLLLGKVRVHLLCPHTRATSTRALGQLLLTAQLSATPHLIQQILLMMEWYERKKRRGMEMSVLTMTSANGWGCTTEVQVHFAFEPFIRDINLLISYAKSANKLCSDTSPS